MPFALSLFAALLASAAPTAMPALVAPPPPAEPLALDSERESEEPVADDTATQADTASEPAVAPDAAADASDEAPKWDVAAAHGPGKDVAIDTTTGTWMSLDVSPDGREIAFDMLGNLYTIPITGGEARALTTGGAWDMQPRYSPDGQSIAFTSDRAGGDNIWTIDRDGSNPQQVTKEDFRLLNQADWTPDSQYIVARKHFTSSRSLGAGEMWLYHRSGGSGVQLTKRRTEQKDSNEPAYSPDGKYLYFSDDVTPGKIFEYSKDVNGEIYAIQRLDLESGELEKYIGGPGGSIRPTPSPDGKSLAFIRRDRYKSVLYVMDIATGRETPITDILDRDMQETWAIHGVYPGMEWTPDNKSIVFWAQGGIKRVDVASKQVSDIPFHVADSRRVADAVRHQVDVAPDRFDVKMIRFAHTSPDGQRVVFEALGHLWIRDVKGGTAKRLTGDGDHFELYPSWSRDGRQIVYVTWNDDEQGAVRTIAASGGGSGKKVTELKGNFHQPGLFARRQDDRLRQDRRRLSDLAAERARDGGVRRTAFGRRGQARSATAAAARNSARPATGCISPMTRKVRRKVARACAC